MMKLKTIPVYLNYDSSKIGQDQGVRLEFWFIWAYVYGGRIRVQKELK